jgi:hypothetical protein
MNIKELLLKGQSFPALLKSFSLEAGDINIHHEDLILLNRLSANQEVLKEDISIEGKNGNGIVNFYGTLHFNMADKLAVFEMQGFDKLTLLN